MICSHIDPPGVLPRIIHPTRSYLTKRGDLKIMDPDSLRVALGSKLPSILFECPDKLLLFRIDRNDGLVGGLKFLDLLVNRLKLGIAAMGSFPLPGALCNPLLWLAGKLSGRLGNQSGASVSKSKRLCGNVEPQAPLIQQRSKQFIALPYHRCLHTNSITRQRKM
jgi:hypothetical protein